MTGFRVVLTLLLASSASSQIDLERLAKAGVGDAHEDHSSVIVGDFDGDGAIDVIEHGDAVIVGPPIWGLVTVPARAYRNQGDGSFVDVSAVWAPPFESREPAEPVDLDGDGDLDVALIQQAIGFTPSARLCFNDGNGSLVDATNRLSPVVAGKHVATLDADGDGDVDLLFDHHLFVNDGVGFFSEVASGLPASATGFVDHLVVGDLDGDGDVDVLMPDSGEEALYLNDGSGFFTVAGGLVLGSVLDIELADVDASGSLDLVIARGGEVEIWFNDGVGVFTEQVGAVPVVPAGSGRLTVADFEGDGDPDIFSTAGGSSHVFVNDGSGVFSVAGVETIPPTVTMVRELVPLDIEQDGDTDLVAVIAGRNRLLVNIDGRYLDTTGTVMPDDGRYETMLWVDLDGDGFVDLVDANGGLSGNVGIQWNDRGMRYGVRDSLAASTGAEIEAADFDGDGDVDLVTGGTLLRNEGQRVFSPGYSGFSVGPSVAVGDIDGDGDQDLVSEGGFDVYANDGTGSFTRVLPNPIYSNTGTVELADVDGDGDPDALLTLTSTGGYVDVGLVTLRNDGTGRFSFFSQLVGEDHMTHLALEDVDRDGDLDAWTSGSRLLVNDGTGVFTVDRSYHATTSTSNDGAYPVDLDGEGDLDLVVTDHDDPAQVWENRGTGGYVDVTSSAWNAPPSTMKAPQFADVDGDGDVDVLSVHQSGVHARLYHNLQQQLSATTMARVGGNYRVVLDAQGGVAAALLLQLQTLPSPVVTPFGLQHLDLGTAFATPILTMTGDRLVVDLPLPANLVSLLGLEMYTQGVVARTSVGVRFTNLISDRLFL